MNATYRCGNSTDTINGRTLFLLIEDWELYGYTVRQTADGFAVTFANGYVRTYSVVR